jgi:hypothetical protein
MKNAILIIISLFIFTGCAKTSAVPLGNGFIQIDAEAPPVLGRTGAQKAAIKKAAETTLSYGKHSFIVVDKASWSDLNFSGSSQGGFSATPNYASGGYSSNFGTSRTSQSTIIIKVFDKGEKGSKGAISAQNFLDSLEPKREAKEIKK